MISLLKLLTGPAILRVAATGGELTNFTHDALTVLITLASLAATAYLVKGGYLYITSSGKPESLDRAKRTIRTALVGLAIVIGASAFSSLLHSLFTHASSGGLSPALSVTPVTPVAQSGSLTQVLLDAITGFFQNIVTSSVKPIMDGVVSFLTTTPSLAGNSVVFNFWLVMVGITDSLFALVVALLGLHVMSASTFGLDELRLSDLMPRIIVAFLAANTSIFIADWAISLCSVLIHAVFSATGGIGKAWILNAFNTTSLTSGGTALITLMFMVIFTLLSAILLLFYISRLMLLAFGAAMSPIVCLLWLLPSTTGFAVSTITAYLVTIFTLFIHVVIIQLASGFLTVPGQAGTNPFISVLIGIAMFSILLKTTATTLQLALTSQAKNSIGKVGDQIMNVLGSGDSSARARGL